MFPHDILIPGVVPVLYVMEKIDFQFLADHIVDMVCEVGADLMMRYTSPSCERLLGWKPEEMVGKGPEAFVHPADLPVVVAARVALFKNGVDRTPTLIRMRNKSGDYVWMEVNARLVRDPPGGVVRSIILVMRDVGFRLIRDGPWHIRPNDNGMENGLREGALDFFYKAFRLSPVPMAVATFHGFHLIDINAAFSETLGYAVDDLIGHGAVAAGLISRQHLDRIIAPIKNIGYVKNLEIDVRHSDGTTRHCLVSAEAIAIRERHCILGVLQDVTQQRRSDGDIIAALESVMHDTSWFSRAVVEKLAQVRRRNGAGTPDPELVDLTAREYRVLSLMCEGLSDTEIATALSISDNTIRNHVSRIYEKIGVHRRGAAIVWARDRGVSVQRPTDGPVQKNLKK